MQNNIICVVGPTASGKTKLAVELAKAYNGEVLSCDSMQLYKRMDIGTAKPTAEEMQGIPHHMIDILEPDEAFSVGRYVELADPILRDILARGKTCVVCGGTGLYVDSLIAGRSFAPFPQTGRREELEALAEEKGIEAVIAMLREVDPDSAERLHPSDKRRIIRAAEVWLETGKTITAHNEETKKIPPRYDAVWIGLRFEERDDMRALIDLRVDKMVEEGLLEEIEQLLANGLSRETTAWQAIGYKEFLGVADGTATVEEAVAEVKLRSRQYAKRQLTWLRRNEAIHWIEWKKERDFERALQLSTEILRSAGVS